MEIDPVIFYYGVIVLLATLFGIHLFFIVWGLYDWWRPKGRKVIRIIPSDSTFTLPDHWSGGIITMGGRPGAGGGKEENGIDIKKD